MTGFSYNIDLIGIAERITMIKRMFASSAQFTKLEEAILSAVREKLQVREVELWDKQLSVINKIYRSPDGLEICLYVIRNGKSNFPQELRFMKDGEFKIAVVDIVANAGSAKLRARVWCVAGHVFTVVYKTSYKKFENLAQGEWQVHCHLENYPV